MPVHNHGTEEGKGLACRELMVNGELKGECLRQPGDLRTRIAAALKDGLKSHGGYYSERSYEGVQFVVLDGNYDIDYLADAVISELKQTEERADKQRPMHVCATPGLHYRYVTDWKADDE